MKALTSILTSLILQASAEPPARIEIDFEPPKVDNEFSKRNPDYKPRAASFYERKYLPGAAEYLFEVCSIDPGLHPYVMEVLRAFVYEWADAYMRGNGGVPEEALTPIVKRMDDRLLALMDESQKERFPAWRNTKTDKNPLKFLMGGDADESKSEQAAPSDGDKPAN